MSEQEKRVQGQGPELVPDLALAEFELQLARAMRRADAPEGFAARVMERAASPSESAQKVVAMRPRFGMARMQAWAGGAIAATLALGMFGAEQVHQRHVREVLAQQQFETATRITDQVLERTREQLARAGVLNDVE
jgi:hypothetical protein